MIRGRLAPQAHLGPQGPLVQEAPQGTRGRMDPEDLPENRYVFHYTNEQKLECSRLEGWKSWLREVLVKMDAVSPPFSWM